MGSHRLAFGLAIALLFGSAGRTASDEPSQRQPVAEAKFQSVPSASLAVLRWTEVDPPEPDPKAFAASLLGPDQFACLEKLWNHESHWDHLAKNRTSGAYGIPQALPATKMASAGSDWATNPITQVIWGLGYIKNRYGTPCKAWNLWLQRGWY